jgi:hypothetical protein
MTAIPVPRFSISWHHYCLKTIAAKVNLFYFDSVQDIKYSKRIWKYCLK